MTWPQVRYGVNAEIRHQSVSVAVPTFNRSQLLARAIRSISNQIYPATEIIVIDDCSTDDTQSVISAYACDIPLVYVQLEKNSGGAVARNAGITRAAGDYIAFLDSDDEWQQDHLLTLMQAALPQSGDFVVASSAIRIGKKRRGLPGLEYPQWGSVAEKLNFVLSAALAFQTSTLLMPQQTARRFMFDPRLRRHQDWDLIFRMIESDVLLVLLPEPTVRYYTPDVTSVSNVGISRSEFPSLRFLVKHKGQMSAKSKLRFVTLQILRRRYMGFQMLKYLLHATVWGSLGIKELVYYARESIFAGISRQLVDGKKRK